MLVLLWTDIFLWLIVGLCSLFITNACRREDMKPVILKLTSSKTVVISSMIIALFAIVGLLDSIHYKSRIDTQSDTEAVHNVQAVQAIQAVQTMSYLDHLFGDRSNTSEITFASPFSSHLYQKDKVINADGTLIFDYPLLKHVSNISGAQLVTDIIKILIFSSLLTCLLHAVYKFKYKQFDSRAAIFYGSCFFIILSLVLILHYLSIYFHIMGTDKIGRDVFYMTIKSIRTGLIIGSLTIAIMAVLAVTFGTLAGYYGGKVDDGIQYIYTTLTSIPSVLLIAASVLIVQAQISLNPEWFKTIEEQADARLLSLCIIIGLTSWSGLCRLIRAETLKIKQLDYVLAARAMQVSTVKIITRHIIPNLGHILILSLVLDFSGMVLAEAVLSYIGVGVDATTMSWGNMINAARSELSRDPIIWWNIIAAFIPMFTFVLALNLLADKLRDALDPKIKG